MKRNIWRQCKRKKRYRDEHAVNHYRRIFEQERGKKLDYYWCPYCNGYHLTSAEFIAAYLGLEEVSGLPAIAVG